jgi:hypothetical protein
MRELILAAFAMRMDGRIEQEWTLDARNREAGEGCIPVAIRKCFLLLNERVAVISIRGTVAIRTAGRVIRGPWFETRDARLAEAVEAPEVMGTAKDAREPESIFPCRSAQSILVEQW